MLLLGATYPCCVCCGGDLWGVCIDVAEAGPHVEPCSACQERVP